MSDCSQSSAPLETVLSAARTSASPAGSVAVVKDRYDIKVKRLVAAVARRDVNTTDAPYCRAAQRLLEVFDENCRAHLVADDALVKGDKRDPCPVDVEGQRQRPPARVNDGGYPPQETFVETDDVLAGASADRKEAAVCVLHLGRYVVFTRVCRVGVAAAHEGSLAVCTDILAAYDFGAVQELLGW